METLLENKKFVIIGAVILVLVILGGSSWYVLSTKKTETTANVPVDQQEAVPTLSPDAIGLSLTPTDSKGGKAIDMLLTKIAGITSIDYEVSYNVVGNIPRGVIGHIDINSGDSTAKQQVFLGTCSDVCHPDNVISAVKFTLKITKSDGKIYQVEQSVDL